MKSTSAVTFLKKLQACESRVGWRYLKCLQIFADIPSPWPITRAQCYKTFLFVIYEFSLLGRVFFRGWHFRPSPMFVSKSGAFLSKTHFRFYPLEMLLALPTNIVLGWKGLTGTNTLAYYEHFYITVVKGFIILGPVGKFFQSEVRLSKFKSLTPFSWPKTRRQNKLEPFSLTILCRKIIHSKLRL